MIMYIYMTKLVVHLVKHVIKLVVHLVKHVIKLVVHLITLIVYTYVSYDYYDGSMVVMCRFYLHLHHKSMLLV